MWICPTFQRPERLAELAASWERCEPGRTLLVRIWNQDPRADDYFNYEWPKGWLLYESGAKGAGEALQEAFRKNPQEETYGWLGDDIVLRTPGGLRVLEETAGDWFLAWPNDTIQRHQLCTHWCVGGDLARTVGYFSHPKFKHNLIDIVWWNLHQYTGIGRYCPNVVFQHRHFLNGQVEKDATYAMAYPTNETSPHGKMQKEAEKELMIWQKGGGFAKDVNKIRKAFLDNYELYGEWEDEDVTVHCSTG